MPVIPAQHVDWTNKEDALAALKVCYPKKEAWNLELAYDMFLASQEEGNAELKEEVKRLEKLGDDEIAPNPTIAEFDGYEYDISNNVKIFTPEEAKAQDWFCQKCNAWQPIDRPSECNFQRHENGTHCVPCMEAGTPRTPDAE